MSRNHVAGQVGHWVGSPLLTPIITNIARVTLLLQSMGLYECIQMYVCTCMFLLAYTNCTKGFHWAGRVAQMAEHLSSILFNSQFCQKGVGFHYKHSFLKKITLLVYNSCTGDTLHIYLCAYSVS
jgi:hypothetical protein